MSETPDNPFEEGKIEDDGIDETPGNPGVTNMGPGNLLNGSVPGPSVSELMSDYGISRPWAILVRGGTRAAVGDGIPPLVEIIVGGTLGYVSLSNGDESGIDSEPGEDEEEMFE
jgi:hypothetical protein